MDALKSSKLFSGLLSAELQQLQQTTEIKSYKANQEIFREGDVGDGIYLVNEGCVQISALVGPGKRRVLYRVGPGDFFGEMAVLDNAPRSATATAEMETVLCHILRDDLLQLLERSPKLVISLLREFSQRMRDFNRLYINEVLESERLTMVGRFARTIVHDFKNPLTIINLACELAVTDSTTPEARQKAQARIRRQVDRLTNMTNELLEFTRGSQSPLLLAPTDYSAYVQQLLDDISTEVSERSVSIECANPPPEVRIPIDPRRLQHVFYNLINNAVDEMPQGGKIVLRFQTNPNELVTEIEDSGKGIAPEIADSLFEPFVTYGKPQGTGLGLSICKRIIEDHRGRIEARSVPGHGAIFCFTLPLKRS